MPPARSAGELFLLEEFTAPKRLVRRTDHCVVHQPIRTGAPAITRGRNTNLAVRPCSKDSIVDTASG